MSNVGRILTLVIEIQTSEYPKWIMDAHMKQSQSGTNDVKVKAIAEGDIVKKYNDLYVAVDAEVNMDDNPGVASVMED